MTDAERDLLVKTAEGLVGMMEVLKEIGGAGLPGVPSMQKELLEALNHVRYEGFFAEVATRSGGRSGMPPGEPGSNT